MCSTSLVELAPLQKRRITCVCVARCTTRSLGLGMTRQNRSHKIISASVSILHRARMPWIVEHPCDSWFWKANIVFGWKRGQQRVTPSCPQMCGDMWMLQCVWIKTCSSKGWRITFRVFALHVTTPAHERTSVPEKTSFEWNGIFTQRVKGYCMEVVDLALACGFGTSGWRSVFALVAYLTQSLIARTDLQTR